jgi:hypothetical protein
MAGPFDSGQPLDGLFRLAGFLGAVGCLATRSPIAATAAVEGAVT